MTRTEKQVRAEVTATVAISEAIRELREVPSGLLYAQVMNHISLDEYTRILRVLSGAGLIAVDGTSLIRWIGPNF